MSEFTDRINKATANTNVGTHEANQIAKGGPGSGPQGGGASTAADKASKAASDKPTADSHQAASDAHKTAADAHQKDAMDSNAKGDSKAEAKSVTAMQNHASKSATHQFRSNLLSNK